VPVRISARSLGPLRLRNDATQPQAELGPAGCAVCTTGSCKYLPVVPVLPASICQCYSIRCYRRPAGPGGGKPGRLGLVVRPSSNGPGSRHRDAGDGGWNRLSSESLSESELDLVLVLVRTSS
jgi:hypothetical protein